MAVLQSHDWPVNVRQLRNNVERLVNSAGGDIEAVISASMLPQDVGAWCRTCRTARLPCRRLRAASP